MRERGLLEIISQIIIPSQPFDLWPGIPVNNVALIVLETPGDDNQDVALADPDFFLDFSLDPSETGDPVETFYPDVVCTHHQFCHREHFTVPFLRKPHPDDLLARGSMSGLFCQ
jgi:hypothetical protein